MQMVGKLVRFRNSLAHGKTHTLKPKDELHSASADIDKLFWDRPMTDWEKLCTHQFATSARVQVEALIRQIHSAANITDEAPFVHGFGFHSATSA
jgi:hypothetical protein